MSPGGGPKRYLVACDFDQTLSFNDTGLILSELLGIPRFHDRVAGLSQTNLVQQGGELVYLLRHDPEYRRVRREHLLETGRRIRLKKNLQKFKGSRSRCQRRSTSRPSLSGPC